MPTGPDPLLEVATTGHSKVEWEELKAPIAVKINEVCAEYYAACKDIDNVESYAEALKRILTLLHEFPNAPFTVQRLCELLVDPHRIYKTSTRKMMSAVEKLLTVSSTVPMMQTAVPKEGTYQVAAEFELGKLLTGEQGGEGDAQPMDVEN